MTNLTVRIFPGDQKVIAATIYDGEDFVGQGGTAPEALIDLGTAMMAYNHTRTMKAIEDEIRASRSGSFSESSDSVSKDSTGSDLKALWKSAFSDIPFDGVRHLSRLDQKEDL